MLLFAGGVHEVMVTEGSIDNYGNIIHVHTSSLQPLQTLQNYTYHPASSSGRHSPSDAATAAAAYSSSSDVYQHGGSYHHQGKSQQDHHYHHHGNFSASSRMDPTLYNKIEVIPSYKSNLHGATAQVYTALASPPSTTYDQTATLYRQE